MNNVITKFKRQNTQLVSYDYNTKVFIDFRIKEQAKHKPNQSYLLLSNKIDILFKRVQSLSTN